METVMFCILLIYAWQTLILKFEKLIKISSVKYVFCNKLEDAGPSRDIFNTLRAKYLIKLRCTSSKKEIVVKLLYTSLISGFMYFRDWKRKFSRMISLYVKSGFCAKRKGLVYKDFFSAFWIWQCLLTI